MILKNLEIAQLCTSNVHQEFIDIIQPNLVNYLHMDKDLMYEEYNEITNWLAEFGEDLCTVINKIQILKGFVENPEMTGKSIYSRIFGA